MNKQISRRDFLKLAGLGLATAAGLGQAAKLRTLASPFSSQATALRPNILILVFDSLSALHLPVYGYQRNTTPNMARFANRSLVYHHHYSSGSFTSPGTASILTGVYPWQHRALHMHGTVLDEFADKNLFSLTPSEYYKAGYSHNLLAVSLMAQFKKHIHLLKPTRDLSLMDPQLADRLFSKDANVAYWSEQLALRGNGDDPPTALFGGLIYQASRWLQKRIATRPIQADFPLGVPNLNDIYFILEDAADWIIEEVSAMPQPYLSYFHVLPPHEPYFPHKDFVGVFADHYKPLVKPESFFTQNFSSSDLHRAQREYDEYLAYADHEFGRILDALEEQGVFDNTVVILTSDHGQLFERGIHGHVTPVLYEALIHIPLIISVPGLAKRQDIQTTTGNVDLLPTILSLTGQPIPDWIEGQVLPGLGGAENDQRIVYNMDAKSSPKVGPLSSMTVSIHRGSDKLVYYQRYRNYSDGNELFNLKNDPDELHNQAPEKQTLAAEYVNLISEKIQQHEKAGRH